MTTLNIPDGKITELTCPHCGRRLVVRTNHQTDEQFRACSGWPQCEYTRDIPEAWRMQKAGQPTLFGDGGLQ